jgi:hypothetical protein
MTSGRLIMPGKGPKYRPWSTATTTAFFPSENNLDKRIDWPVTGMAYSFIERMIPKNGHSIKQMLPIRMNNW